MKLTFLGADREVTGSCTQLEAAGHRFLIDCGMEQGRDVYENADLPCAPGTYEALLLTHAHIDHSGRIPYLYKNGYRGPIYTTDATRDLCAIMLEDSAHIQEQEAEWKNRKAMRSGAEMIEPDYTVEDAQNVMKQFVPCPYETWQTLFDGPTGKIEMRFTDVGHLLGSASVSLRIAEPGRTPEIIVFSGDIGNTHQPLIKDPSNPGHADYLVMESTYGDRSHGPKPDYIGDLSAVLQSTFDKGGNVVIPSFAVGRTQELLYFIRQIKAEGRIKGHENFPVFVDSPLASKSTTIFRENFAECYDDEALALVQSGQNPLQFPGLHVSETKEESMAINGDPTPKVILSAACMVRCMCGFEFITTFLILCKIPLCYAAAKAYFVRRDPHGALVWLGRTVGAGVSALGGVTAALALWFAQEWLCFGSAADAWQNMTRAVTDRVSLTDGAVRDVNVPQVLAQYFGESTEPLLQLGPVSVTAWQLLLFALLVGAVSVVACLRRGTAAQLVPPCIVWGLGLAAPASWMVLSKAHAAIHTHLVPMLWHFAFVPISCMLLPVLAKLMIPGRKKDLVASH